MISEFLCNDLFDFCFYENVFGWGTFCQYMHMFLFLFLLNGNAGRSFQFLKYNFTAI